MRIKLGQWGPAVRLMILCTIALGIVYPMVVVGVGKLMSAQANGSLVHVNGQLVGSSLLAQDFGGQAKYFQERPSAAGPNGYDPTATGGTNLSLDSQTLYASINHLKAVDAALDGVSTTQVPADAVMSSASGLDPHISPAYAAEQVSRVAAARNLSVATVQRLVAKYTQGRTLGIFGELRVNVLELNLALDRLGS